MSCASACVALGLSGAGLLSAQTNVTTYHNDIGRTGQNLNETILNTSNVNATQFGKLFSQPVDGQVYAQPLYLSGITVNGATHNVIFVATENDSVYAFDADSNGGANGSPLWKDSLLSTAFGAAAGATTVPSSLVSTDINPQVGITGTPVIDPATGTLYVVSKTYEGSTAVQRLHALDVTTGAEKFGGPRVLTASVPGTGNGSVNGTLTFDPLWENQRPGLLLLNGIVWIGFAAHGDNGPWHGWILGYKASTLAQTGAYCATPNGTGGGFWMSGGGLAADQLDTVNHPYGRMFLPTGNGDYTATKPYTNSMDYGDSHLDLDLTNGVPTITDEFTTYNQAFLNSQDGDIASGGLLVLPTQTTGSYPHLLVQVGKSGTMFLLNRDNLGGYNTTADQGVQEQTYAVGGTGAWSSPAYWNGNVYYWGRVDKLKSFPLVNGLLGTTPTESSETYGYPGATPSISANGSTQGIVWSIDSEATATNGPAVLQAHDASNVATTLYSSTTNAARDTAGTAVKFTVPTVVNGKVYVGAASEIDFYGLLNGITQTSAPSISPGTESYNLSVSVTITDATPGAAIYYTSDGTAPTTSSTLYTGPITVTSTETINAIASASGYLISAQASATFTNVSQATAVVFSIPTGTYGSTQSLTLTDTTASAAIYYTTDGSTPTTASTLYTGAISVASTETVTAIAVAPGVSNSVPLSQTYTIIPGLTGVSYPIGFAASTGTVILNGSTTLNDTRLQLTNGGTGQAGSAWYYQPLNIQSFTSDFTFQLSNPVGDGITFAIENDPKGFYALGLNGSGKGYQNITKSIAIKFDLVNSGTTGANSTGLYLNGAAPTTPFISLNGTGINLLSDDTMSVHLTYNGTTLTMTMTDLVTAAVWSTSWTVNIPSTVGANTAYVGFTGGTGAYTASQKILTWSLYNVSATAAATPTFTPAAGSYTTAQTVSMASLTPAASIYYTTNGTTPTTSSTLYSAPITVSTSETVKAIATATGYSASNVASAVYTIGGTAAMPTFTPGGGSYTSAQTVSIADATTGATIYYTTNGSAPTTSSTVYTGPITVSTSETLSAIAAATGFTTSAVGTAVYTITPTATATPTFSLPTGTYTSTQSVSLSDATSGAVIYYTTNGTTPTTASTVYSAPISVSSTETITAIAVAAGMNASPALAQTYTISTAQGNISYPTGFSASPQLVLNGSAAISGTAIALTNGGSGQAGTFFYATPVNIQAFTTNFTFQIVNPSADGMTFTIQNSTQKYWAHGNNAGGLGYQGITPSVAVKFDLFNDSGEGADSTGLYLNGAAPTIPFTDMSATGINLHSGDTMAVQMSYDGTTLSMTITDTVTAATWSTSWPVNIPSTVGANTAYVGFTGGTGGLTSTQNVLTWSFAPVTSPVAATPTFTPAAGSYSSTQSVTIADATAGAVIYYTTNGTTPTTSSTVYSGPISVAATETINAIAIASGYANSSVGSAAYTITASTATATPVLSLASGTYNVSPVVTITDATSGAKIYYTVNGTTPTTSSTLYSTPITVASSETIEAIAIAPSFTQSGVASAAYSLVAATPVISPAGGTFTAPVSATITSASTGATIYYTTNGTTPTTSSTVYTGAITVTGTETIEAIAAETGFTSSGVASNTYTISTPIAATPTFTPAAGTYTSAQTVTIADATAGASIYYTTNGTTPTTSSTLYTGAITVSATETLEAIAVAAGYANSSVATAAYTINTGTLTVNYASGFTTTGINLNMATVSGGALVLTDGGSAEERSAWTTAPINVQKFTTDFTFQQTTANADGFTFTIQDAPKGIYALGTNGGGLGYAGIASSVAVKFDLFSNSGEGADSTGFYTNGASPTVPSVDMSTSAINLHSGDIMHAHITYDGTTLTLTITDTVTNGTFTTSTAINIPTTVGANTAYVGFTGGTGGLTATQKILTWTYSVN